MIYRLVPSTGLEEPLTTVTQSLKRVLETSQDLRRRYSATSACAGHATTPACAGHTTIFKLSATRLYFSTNSSTSYQPCNYLLRVETNDLTLGVSVEIIESLEDFFGFEHEIVEQFRILAGFLDELV